MIFLNQSLPIQRRYMSDDPTPKLEVCLGNKSGEVVAIELPSSFLKKSFLERGMHHDLTLEDPYVRRLRVVEREDKTCYGIISTYRESTAFGHGCVYDSSEAGREIRVYAKATGFDTDSKDSYWHDYVLGIPERGEFFVQWSGYKLGVDCMTCWHQLLSDDMASFVMSQQLTEDWPRTSAGTRFLLPYYYINDVYCVRKPGPGREATML